MLNCYPFLAFQDVDCIFSNIVDIRETTIQFYSMLDAAVEMADEDSLSKKSPLIGDCFEEMAEVRRSFEKVLDS